MKHVALFIDADNISAQHHHAIISTAKNYGTLTIKRVYTNWTKETPQLWKNPCIQYGLTAVQQFDHLSGKNASDMAISVDIMEVLFNKAIDVFCVVTSDSDFTPVCLKLQEYGKTVIGIGNKNASKSLINACHEFHYLTKEEQTPPLVLSNPVNQHQHRHHPNPNKDQKLKDTIKTLIAKHGDNGSLTTAQLGTLIRQALPSFEPSHYGYKKFSDVLKVMSDFETYTDNSTQFIRLYQAKTVVLDHDVTPPMAVQSALDSDALVKDATLTNALSNAIAIHQNADGWAWVGHLDGYLSDTFGIISQNYGYSSTLEMLKNLSMLFTLKKHSGKHYVQDKRTTLTAKPKSKDEVTTRQSGDALRANHTLMEALYQGIHTHVDAHGWALSPSVGAFLKNLDISPKHYGYRNLTELIKAIELFDVRQDDGASYFKDPNFKVNQHSQIEQKLTSETLESSQDTDVTNELLNLLSLLDDPQDEQDDLQSAITHAMGELGAVDDWVRASSVSDYLRRRHGLRIGDLGFASFAELYESLDYLECQKQGRVLLIKTVKS